MKRSDGYVPKKLFTVEQANRMLPLVSRIATDASSAFAEFLERYEHYRRLIPDDASTLNRDQVNEIEQMRTQLETEQQRILDYAAELEDLGVEFKGGVDGLCDFPAIRDGRVVYLCWKVGESRIGHWHELDAGFIGRQPLEEAELFAASHGGKAKLNA